MAKGSRLTGYPPIKQDTWELTYVTVSSVKVGKLAAALAGTGLGHLLLATALQGTLRSFQVLRQALHHAAGCIRTFFFAWSLLACNQSAVGTELTELMLLHSQPLWACASPAKLAQARKGVGDVAVTAIHLENITDESSQIDSLITKGLFVRRVTGWATHDVQPGWQLPRNS
eukprot:5445468-Pleurochrysis_carterae.AAC.3